MTQPAYTFDKSLRRRRRPLKAYRHFRKLIANKEDTTQVFKVIEALNGDAFQNAFLEFANSPQGAQRLAERRHLPPLLDNHDALRAMPDGSLGRAYLDFMTREGLSAQGLVDEFEASGISRDYGNEDMMWYGHRRRDTHDMLHILTGLGRDALGEASVLGFTYGLYGGAGVAFIGYGAALEVRKSAPKGAPCLASVSEAKAIGKAAKDIVYEDIMALLPLPLEEVRARLNITLPTKYHRVHEMMRGVGMDPYADVIQPAAA